jgi:phage gp29-like protein
MNAYLERDGMPWVIAEYDEQILNALFPELEAEEAANEITNLIKSKVADAILALPKGMQIKIENPAGQGTNANNYKMMIDLCNEAISRVWTGHTATTIATPGKLGSDQNANDGLDDVIDDAKEIVVETFNQLISWLVTINYSENVVLPFFQFYQEKDINLDLSTRDKTLFDQGVRPKKAYFSREYSIPEDEFEIVEPSTAQGGNMADTVIKAFMSPVIEEIKLGVVGDAKELRNKVVAIAGEYGEVEIDYMIKKCLEWAQ